MRINLVVMLGRFMVVRCTRLWGLPEKAWETSQYLWAVFERFKGCLWTDQKIAGKQCDMRPNAITHSSPRKAHLCGNLLDARSLYTLPALYSPQHLSYLPNHVMLDWPKVKHSILWWNICANFSVFQNPPFCDKWLLILFLPRINCTKACKELVRIS
jgi:hypothetical protein